MASLISFPDEILLRVLRYLHLDASALLNVGLTCQDFRRLVVDHAYRIALKWQRRRFLDEALLLFSVVLKLEPTHAGALDERAITRFNVSDKAGAIRDLKRSAAVASTESERLTFESVWLEMNGELQASMQRSRRALELNPSNGRAYFELAYVYQELPFEPDMQEAIKNYSLALEHGYHRAYVTVFNRGFAKEAAHDFAGAIEDYRLTMKMNPYFSQAARNGARLMHRDAQVARLRDELAALELGLADCRARKIPPSQSAHLLVQQAQIRDVLREDDAALELYDRAIAAGHPRPATLHSARAYLLEEHGRQAEAEAAWDAAVASEPASATLREGRAKFFLRTHQRPKAMLDFERILSCAGAEAHGYELFSHLARERGQLEEAEKHAEDALAVHPAADRVETRMLLGELRCRNGKFEKALECYSRVISLYPAAQRPRLFRASVLLRLGRVDDAMHEYGALLEIDKENEIALCNLGCLMFCRGDMESAEDLFSRRLKVSMADFRALCNRAHARLKRGNFVGALEDYLALRLHYPASVSQDMVDGIRTQPSQIARLIGNKNMLFSSTSTWEDWMRRAHEFLETESGGEEGEAGTMESDEEWSE